MKKLHYLLLTIVLIVTTAPGCKKNKTEEQLPPETHVGAFTFGCKVDGKIYTASGKDGLLISEYVDYSFNSIDSIIYISAVNTKNPKFSFDLTIHYLDSIGTYAMKTYPYEGIFNDNSNGSLPGPSNTFTTSDNHIGYMSIKYFNGVYAPYNQGTILAGTFEMDALNGEGKVIHITDGRFDIGQ